MAIIPQQQVQRSSGCDMISGSGILKVMMHMLALSKNKHLNGGIDMNKITAKDIAEVFVKLSDVDSGDVLTNLKLQKLVYYAQGFHLAVFEKPLFEDNIVAWEHGPVVESLYHELKKFGAKQVQLDDPLPNKLNKDQLSLLAEINSVFGQFSAWKLRDMTHNESPWLTTPRGEVISVNKLTDYFKTQMV